MSETFTLGTHNLHDDAGSPSMFADVVLFTEAVPRTVRARLGQRARFAAARAAGRQVVVCREQRDLVVVVRRSLIQVTGTSYHRFVEGLEGVTPHRGTFTVYGKLRESGQLVAVNVEHRINAAFAPWVRGEPAFRRAAWSRHTSGTLDLVDRQAASGYVVLAGGDVNTPERIAGYSMAGVLERGERLDRLAVVAGRTPVRVGRAEYLSRKGSDHPRLRVTVRLPLEVVTR